MEISSEAAGLADVVDSCCYRGGWWWREMAEAIQAELSKKDAQITGLMNVIKFQATLLSDAGDLFDELGMVDVWHRLLATAQSTATHGTITAQSGLRVYDSAHLSPTMCLENAGAAERT